MTVLPPHLLQRLHQYTDGESPRHVARALYDLDGSLGSTFLALTSNRVFFFARDMLKDYEEFSAGITDIQRFELTDQGPFTTATLHNGQATLSLKFSCWENPTLEKMVNHWREQSPDAPSAPAPALTHPTPPVAESPASVEADSAPPFSPTPLHAFCAAVNYVTTNNRDKSPDSREQLILAHAIQAPQAVNEGLTWLGDVGLDKVREVASAALNAEQKHCLLATVMDFGFTKDGFVPMVEDFRQAFQISEDHAEHIEHALRLKNEASFGDDLEGGRTAHVTFAALLFTMLRSDGKAHALEQDLIKAKFDNHQFLQEVERYQRHTQPSALLDSAAQTFSERQKEAAIVTMTAVSLIDGHQHPRERELLQGAVDYLDLKSETFQQLHAAIFQRYHLACFQS